MGSLVYQSFLTTCIVVSVIYFEPCKGKDIHASQEKILKGPNQETAISPGGIDALLSNGESKGLLDSSKVETEAEDGGVLSKDKEENRKRSRGQDGNQHGMVSAVSGDTKLCGQVCQFCRTVLSMRWAALCLVQCLAGGVGQAYNGCLVAWANKDDIFH